MTCVASIIGPPRLRFPGKSVPRRLRLYLGLVTLAASLGGCNWSRSDRLESEYGDLRNRRAAKTVDGLDVLAELFRDYGYGVRRWRRLSPRLLGRERMTDRARPGQAYDVILWAPDQFEPLTREQYEFLGQFVQEGGTVILVGRDYDAVSDYWRQVLPEYRGDMYRSALREAMLDRAQHWVALEYGLPSESPWYELAFSPGDPRVSELDGPWAEEIDVAATRILCQVELKPLERAGDAGDGDDKDEVTAQREHTHFDDEGDSQEKQDDGDSTSSADSEPITDDSNSDLSSWSRYDPSILRVPQAEVLLDSDRGPLVVRWRPLREEDASASVSEEEMTDGDWDAETGEYLEATEPGEVIFVANGSFLLNMGMLAEGNRALAERLVMECGEGDRLAIIEPQAWMVRVYDVEPGGKHIPPRHEPLATIIDHFAVLGVVACFAVFPLFGRAKVHPTPPLNDIEEHVEAVASLMAKSRNTEYARHQIERYRSLTQREERPTPP